MPLKKILVSSLFAVGSAAAGVAVAVPAVTSSQTQSSTTDVDGDSDNQTVQDTKITIPTSDEFVGTTINYSDAHDDATLNTYLDNLFSDNDVSAYLQGSYKGISFAYVEDSANYDNATFQVTASLNEGYVWSDGSKTTKTVDVSIQSIDKTAPTASIPDDVSATYNMSTVNYSTVSSDSTLDDYLVKELASSDDIFTKLSLTSSNQYSDVALSYVVGSASYANLDFQIQASPLDGYTWSDGTTTAKTIEVTIQNLDTTAWTASAPTTDKFTYTLTSYSDSDLDKQLTNFFNSDSMSKSTQFTYFSDNSSYKNVDWSYVSGSADVSDKTFEISVTPTTGKAWSNDGTVTARTVTVTLSNITVYNTAAAVPEHWSLNVAQKYNGDGMNISSYSRVQEIGYNSLQQVYKNIKYDGSGINYKKDGYISLSLLGGSTNRVWVTSILVSPTSGTVWADTGTTEQRIVQLYYFIAAPDADNYNGDIYHETEVDSVGTAVTDGTINNWISNFVYAPTESDRTDYSTIESKIIADLQATLGNIYYIDPTVVSFEWQTGLYWKGYNANYNYNNETDMILGVYQVKIAPNAENPVMSKLKTITGYVYASSDTQVDFLNSYFA